jgi:hypothetical protein
VLPGAGVDAVALVALQVEAILRSSDAEMAARLFGSAEEGGLALRYCVFARKLTDLYHTLWLSTWE